MVVGAKFYYYKMFVHSEKKFRLRDFIAYYVISQL
jgi:hypothetical protein